VAMCGETTSLRWIAPNEALLWKGRRAPSEGQCRRGARPGQGSSKWPWGEESSNCWRRSASSVGFGCSCSRLGTGRRSVRRFCAQAGFGASSTLLRVELLPSAGLDRSDCCGGFWLEVRGRRAAGFAARSEAALGRHVIPRRITTHSRCGGYAALPSAPPSAPLRDSLALRLGRRECSYVRRNCRREIQAQELEDTKEWYGAESG